MVLSAMSLVGGFKVGVGFAERKCRVHGNTFANTKGDVNQIEVIP